MVLREKKKMYIRYPSHCGRYSMMVCGVHARLQRELIMHEGKIMAHHCQCDGVFNRALLQTTTLYSSNFSAIGRQSCNIYDLGNHHSVHYLSTVTGIMIERDQVVKAHKPSASAAVTFFFSPLLASVYVLTRYICRDGMSAGVYARFNFKNIRIRRAAGKYSTT
jgi:hypothetical protein